MPHACLIDPLFHHTYISFTVLKGSKECLICRGDIRFIKKINMAAISSNKKICKWE